MMPNSACCLRAGCATGGKKNRNFKSDCPDNSICFLATGAVNLYHRFAVGPWRSQVSAFVWGARGRRFESRWPDQFGGIVP